MRYLGPMTASLAVVLAVAPGSLASSGNPQVKTDHPWYPGELSCSTFERLFKTQADLYKRVTGRDVKTDEDKVLAAWYWRNLNYAHAEDGAGDYFDKGFRKWGKNHEYWTGLFAHGFGLCGTTHSQWCAEMDLLLGHCRSRVVGVKGHNSFEVYITGGLYGQGRWVLLDHDISTVIFDRDGRRLLSIQEIISDVKNLGNPKYRPERQRGWRVGGLHDNDPSAYARLTFAEYISGYSGPPPTVHLRSGESLKRYLKPGLDSEKKFVFWGRNYKMKGIPGPERSRTWVNQPEKMYKSTTGSRWIPGMVRYANAVYTYKPDFAGGKYKEGVIDEGDGHVTFEFYTPYVIGCTPAKDGNWGIYDPGGKNGLVLSGRMSCPVKISTDQGKTWQDAGKASDGADLTDLVKGHQQYFIRFEAPAKDLARSGLTMRTVCQCNVAVIPRLRQGKNKVTYLASGRGVVSAGPNKDQGAAHVVDGALDSKTVTLELKTPRGEKAMRLYAASRVASGNPPDPNIKYFIEYSTDKGETWKPVVKDWRIERRKYEPGDFWSQSLNWGDVELAGVDGPVRVRFRNDGGKRYMIIEAHLVYEVEEHGPTEVTFAWRDAKAELKTESHTFSGAAGEEDNSWTVECRTGTETIWVEYSAK